jgi:glycosyltransferase involved in cell wall biosynthesis
VRGGDRVTVLTPHAEGLPAGWTAGGVEVVTFRYAPDGQERLGYGRTLEADERLRRGAALLAPLYALGAHRALRRLLTWRRFDLLHAHWIVPNGLAAAAALGRAGPSGMSRGGRDFAPSGTSGGGTDPGPSGTAGGGTGSGPTRPAGGRTGSGPIRTADGWTGSGPIRTAGGKTGSAVPVPLAIGLHGSDVFLAERAGVRRLARWALSRTAVLTGCSPELVERVCALGFPAGRSRVIPYGVDTRAFSPEPSRRGVWRERLGVPPEAPLVLSVGRMASKKGFRVLFEALPELLAAVPDLHVVLAGGGDQLGELRAAAADWPRVHLPGPVQRDTLPDLYRAADLFVLPAVHDRGGNVDGLPNVILEAMASGLPVVASGISGIPLAVAGEDTGLLVPERDPPALARALRRLLGDRALGRRMGERGRRRAEAELTWDAVGARYREAYLAALAAPP